MKSPIDIYYFSGTGNTLLIIKKMAIVFKENGIETKFYHIEKSDPEKINPNHAIGLAFPVAVGSTFPFVWKFLKKLPKTKNTDVFMVDTLAGMSGGIVGPLKRHLSKKGYNCIGAKEIVMPSNIFYIYSDKKNSALVKKGILKAQKYAKDLISGITKWGSIPFFSSLIYLFCVFITGLWKFKFGFEFKLEKEKCTKCGICRDLCPTNNITMNDYPMQSNKCQLCMRCVSFCPTKALTTAINFKRKTYKAVNYKELLNNGD